MTPARVFLIALLNLLAPSPVVTAHLQLRNEVRQHKLSDRLLIGCAVESRTIKISLA